MSLVFNMGLYGIIGQPSISKNFSDNDWKTIIKACQEKKVPDTWKVGDRKEMLINGSNYFIDIIGKNHDIYTDSSVAPLTFQFEDCYDVLYYMNATNTNTGGWTQCKMRQDFLPIILSKMPQEVQQNIRLVKKKTTYHNKDLVTTNDDLFLLSEYELFGVSKWSYQKEGSYYQFYSEGRSTMKKIHNGGYTVWWERSPITEGFFSRDYFCYSMEEPDAPNRGSPSIERGVAPAFCF